MASCHDVVPRMASDTRSSQADGTNSVTLRKQPGRPRVHHPSQRRLQLRLREGTEQRYALKVDRIYAVRFLVAPGFSGDGGRGGGEAI